MIEKRQFYIDGAWTEALDGRDHEVIDPATEEPCAIIALGGQADTDAAVAAAKRALPGWMATPAAERIALVEKLLAVYKSRAEELAQAMSLEMGAPIALARANQVGAGLFHLQNFVDAAKARGAPVSAEVTPHHLFLTDAAVAGQSEAPGGLAYDTNAKVNPPLRSADDVAACIEALRSGVIDAVPPQKSRSQAPR